MCPFDEDHHTGTHIRILIDFKKKTYPLLGRSWYSTGCPLYRVSEHGSCHGMSRNMRTFCAKKLPCSEDAIKGTPVKHNTIVCNILVAACTYLWF